MFLKDVVMKKIRLSHSLISLWEKGDIQGAIDCYFHVDRVGNKAMEEGKKYHEEFAKSIDEKKALPDYVDFSVKFNAPKTEEIVVVPYNEICDIKGILDCVDKPVLYEWKTGGADSLEWARTHQLPLYFLICELAGIKIDYAYLVHYNQHKNTTDFVIVHNTPKKIETAKNLIDSVSHEIWEYFNEQGLI